MEGARSCCAYVSLGAAPRDTANAGAPNDRSAVTGCKLPRVVRQGQRFSLESTPNVRPVRHVRTHQLVIRFAKGRALQLAEASMYGGGPSIDDSTS